MTDNFADILDEALAAVKTEPVTAVLHRYPQHAQTLAPLLTAAAKLGDWQTFTAETAVSPTFNPNWQTADRTQFLDQIEQFAPVPVSPGPLLRLKGWLTQTRTALRNRYLQKEQKPMNILFARAIATAVVILGLGGGTVAMANDSLPDTPLYPVKLMLEETRMNMAESPVEQAKLQTELAQVRLQEMTQLALAGETIGEAQLTQLQTHLQTALQLAAQTGDPQMIGLLTQLQTMLQNQQQNMAQLGNPALGNVNQLLNQFQERVQAGLADPPMFRWRQAQDEDWEPAGQGQQNGQGTAPDNSGQNGASQGNDTCLNNNCEPVGDQNQFGQDKTNANGPNGPHTNGPNINGPNTDGCLDNADCEPAGDENKHGQDSDNSGQNGNGDFDGDGDGVCENDCEPIGDENQYGQEEDNDGQNGDMDGGGDGDGVCDNDCEPIGDGPQPNPDNGGNGHGNGGNP
ncbi:MAG: hypothetical protein H6654_08545 [Ardenticatenaceae bacterium]|nr:hypothetical protein [Anaerolineales bacterium]MCB8940571.1 hypothetical protein [Ardenticatenaceae bacterium]MCB8973591.1 hypothetical protein [Ardenticatenaceae bacterium]